MTCGFLFTSFKGGCLKAASSLFNPTFSSGLKSGTEAADDEFTLVAAVVATGEVLCLL